MLECLILGDSIAVGISLHRKECISYSIGGYNTWQWNKKFHDRQLSANSVIISLGTNDHYHVKTYDELMKIRRKITAHRVYWIVPAIKKDIQEVVLRIARHHNDYVVPIKETHSDKIHPTSKEYKNLANHTK